MNRHLAHALGATALGALDRARGAVSAAGHRNGRSARTRAQREFCAASRLFQPWTARRRSLGRSGLRSALRRPSWLGFELLPAARSRCAPPSAAAPRDPPPRPPLFLRRRRMVPAIWLTLRRRGSAGGTRGLVPAAVQHHAARRRRALLPRGTRVLRLEPASTRVRGDGSAIPPLVKKPARPEDTHGQRIAQPWRCAMRSRSSG